MVGHDLLHLFLRFLDGAVRGAVCVSVCMSLCLFLSHWSVFRQGRTCVFRGRACFPFSSVKFVNEMNERSLYLGSCQGIEQCVWGSVVRVYQ